MSFLLTVLLYYLYEEYHQNSECLPSNWIQLEGEFSTQLKKNKPIIIANLVEPLMGREAIQMCGFSVAIIDNHNVMAWVICGRIDYPLTSFIIF